MSVYPYFYPGYPRNFQTPSIYPLPTAAERDLRWSAIRQSMQKHGFDCLVICAPFGYMPVADPFLYYVSNYVPIFNRGTYLFFPLEGEPQLGFADINGPQYVHLALEHSWIKDIAYIPDPADGLMAAVQRQKLEKGRLGLVGIGMGIFPAGYYNLLSANFPSARLADAAGALCEAMDSVSRTSKEELEFLKRACDILDRSFDAVAGALKPGVTEQQLWAAAEDAILTAGGWYGHFMMGVTGPDASFPRVPAAHRTIQRGDVVLFEINAIYGGVSPQSSYALSLGNPKPEVKTMFDFCRELYLRALEELEKNRSFRDIETELIERIHRAGYNPMTPQMHRYNYSAVMPVNSPPQPGDYFTVHTNVTNKAYTSGAKVGDVIRLNLDGKVERMNRVPAQLNII